MFSFKEGNGAEKKSKSDEVGTSNEKKSVEQKNKRYDILFIVQF